VLGDEERKWGWLTFEGSQDMVKLLETDDEIRRTATSVYVTRAVPGSVVAMLKAQLVPCYRVWDWSGKAVVAVVVYRL